MHPIRIAVTPQKESLVCGNVPIKNGKCGEIPYKTFLKQWLEEAVNTGYYLHILKRVFFSGPLTGERVNAESIISQDSAVGV